MCLHLVMFFSHENASLPCLDVCVEAICILLQYHFGSNNTGLVFFCYIFWNLDAIFSLASFAEWFQQCGVLIWEQHVCKQTRIEVKVYALHGFNHTVSSGQSFSILEVNTFSISFLEKKKKKLALLCSHWLLSWLHKAFQFILFWI